jgi:hypothetical protein
MDQRATTVAGTTTRVRRELTREKPAAFLAVTVTRRVAPTSRREAI